MWDERRCYSRAMQALTPVLARDPRIAYALLFGSTARGSAHHASDLDIAIGLEPDTARLTPSELGGLTADLESASGRRVDIVLLDEASPPLAYRVFRDGITLLERNRAAFVARKAQAILDYLDFRPTEVILTKGALDAASRG